MGGAGDLPPVVPGSATGRPLAGTSTPWGIRTVSKRKLVNLIVDPEGCPFRPGLPSRDESLDGQDDNLPARPGGSADGPVATRCATETPRSPFAKRAYGRLQCTTAPPTSGRWSSQPGRGESPLEEWGDSQVAGP